MDTAYTLYAERQPHIAGNMVLLGNSERTSSTMMVEPLKTQATILKESHSRPLAPMRVVEFQRSSYSKQRWSEPNGQSHLLLDFLLFAGLLGIFVTLETTVLVSILLVLLPFDM